MDELDRADIHAAGRLRHQQQLGRTSNSRPMMSFCWFPPERARAGRSGFGGRTSKASMIASARRRIAALSRMMPPAATTGLR